MKMIMYRTSLKCNAVSKFNIQMRNGQTIFSRFNLTKTVINISLEKKHDF